MQATNKLLGIWFLGLVLTAACNGTQGEGTDTSGDPSLAGTYHCGNEGEPPGDLLELRDDGTLTFSLGALPGAPPGAPPPEDGDWSADGDSAVFRFTGYEDQVTVSGDRLEFAHAGAPEEEKTICTRAAG